MATEHCNTTIARERADEFISMYRQLPKKAQNYFFGQLKAHSDIRTSTKLTDKEKEQALSQWQKDWMAEFKRSFPEAHEIYMERNIAEASA